MSLCPDCREDDAAWRDYPINNLARPADGYNAKTREYWIDGYYALIRWQRDLIWHICHERHQESEATR